MNYSQVTPAIRTTVDLPGMCARFQWKAFGAKNGWGFGSARQAWEGQANRHVGEAPPAGVDVPIWLSWDLNPDWHAAVMLSNGQVMTSPVSPFPNTPRQDRFPSIAAMIAAFPGNMRYLGWAESMDGTRVVTLNKNPSPSGQEEDEDMKLENRAVCHTLNGVQTVIIGERTSGWKFKYTTSATKGRNPENEKWAAFFETGDFASVTDRSMLDLWESSLDRMAGVK